MSRVADQTQDEAFFKEAIDPTYLLNLNFANDTDAGYGGYQEDFLPMNNADLTSTRFAENTSTGFTPPLYTPNGTSVFNGIGFQSQKPYFGSFDEQQNGYFPSQAVITKVLTNVPMMDSNNGSQDENTQPIDTQSTNVDNRGTQEAYKETRSKQVKETSPPEANAGPPVRKRRARKNKKQLSETEIRAKRERFLERNRIAASKCRDKKKDWTNKMEDKMRLLQADRKMLRELVQTLMDEKRKLTALLHEHSGCNHQGLDAWLREKATAILSSPDVFTPILSQTYSFHSRSSSPTGARNHSSVNGYDGSRRNSLDVEQVNTTSPTSQTNMDLFSPNSQDGLMQKQSFSESMDSPHASPDMYRRNSGNSVLSGDGYRQHGCHRDSGISDMESLETSSVVSSSLFGVQDAIRAPYAVSETFLMGNQRLIGRADNGDSSNPLYNSQFAQA